MNNIQKNTCVQFVPKTATDKHYLRIINTEAGYVRDFYIFFKFFVDFFLAKG